MLKTSDFDYGLPTELIAQCPLPQRGADKLLIFERVNKRISHKSFPDLLLYLKKGDCLVFNDTFVIPARLTGVSPTGGCVSVTLLKKLPGGTWQALVKPGRRMKEGAAAIFGGGLLKCTVINIEENGARELLFVYDGIFEEILNQIGEMPLPPYIKQKLADKDRYQTVYAKNEGAVASPTAGLHFTRDLMDKITSLGVHTAFITLHTGLSTFMPVKEEIIENHKMHEEWFRVDETPARIINNARQGGGRVIAVGTTSARTLETAADLNGNIKPLCGEADIFITPGYKFKAIDGLITNFHLPKSTLIMLVSAFAGREDILNAYAEAIKMRYRFFSFGDAMLIL